MLRKSGFLIRWLRLPSLLLVLLTTVVLVTSLPAATGDVIADRVLGQAVFTLNNQDFVDGAGLDYSNNSIGNLTPGFGLAVDTSSATHHLYLVDPFNNRVLGWENAASFANGQAADLVIGQVDMFHSGCDQPANTFNNATASNLCNPTGVALDASGDLYIADFNDNRVIEYNAPYAAYAGLGQTCTASTPCQNELSANKVFGQFSGGSPSFTTIGCNGTSGENHTTSNEGMCGPEGVSVNPTTGDLYVADALNSRVLVFLNPLASGGGNQGTSGFAGDETADYVFGQTSFTAYSCNQGLSAPTASTLCGEMFFSGGGGVGVDADGNVYIADTDNNRVLQFNTPLSGNPPPSTSFTANAVFGQGGSFTTSSGNLGGSNPSATSLDAPIDVKVDDSFNVYIVDQDNSRILEFNSGGSRTNPSANTVLGQKNFVSNFCPTASDTSLCDPAGVAIDSTGNVFAADFYNNRVLEFDAPLATENEAASAVLGQVFFDTGSHDLVDGKSLNLPPNVAIDPYSTPNHIYVSDGGGNEQFSNRVLAWYDAKTFANGQPADLVFGQPDFYHTAGNNGFNGPGQAGPDTLETPAGMTVDSSSNLYIVDTGNSRVLEYDNPFAGFVPANGPRLTTPGTPSGSSGDTVADRVFGTCGDFTQNSCLSTDFADQLSGPEDVAFDPKNNALYVSLNNPEAVFEYNSPLTNQTANLAIGTCGGGFSANNCGTTTSDATLSAPTGIAVDAQGNLFVADAGNNGTITRLLMYLDPLGSAGGCVPAGDGSGCAGDAIADKAFGTCTALPGSFTANNCSGTGPTNQSLLYGLGGYNSVAVDANENLYAMDPVNSRAIVFQNANSLSGSLTAVKVIGQGPSGTSFNTGSPQIDGITADSLGAPVPFGGIQVPVGIAVDSSCDAYIADTGNNRVLGYDQPVAPCGAATPTPTATSTASTPTATATQPRPPPRPRPARKLPPPQRPRRRLSLRRQLRLQLDGNRN